MPLKVIITACKHFSSVVILRYGRYVHEWMGWWKIADTDAKDYVSARSRRSTDFMGWALVYTVRYKNNPQEKLKFLENDKA